MDFSNIFNFNWSTIPFQLIAFVIAFSLHEWAHAYVAYLLEDNTAKHEGRLTVNPIPHIDPFGLILILFGPFGWAKPVPVNPSNFRGNKRLGMVYVAAAGPLVNIVLAVFFGCLLGITINEGWLIGLSDKWATAINMTLQLCIQINIGLFVFNLLPIPPLDGSKIFRYLSPRRWGGFFEKLELYGPWILLLIIFISPLKILLFYPFYYVFIFVEDIVNAFLRVIY